MKLDIFPPKMTCEMSWLGISKCLRNKIQKWECDHWTLYHLQKHKWPGTAPRVSVQVVVCNSVGPWTSTAWFPPICKKKSKFPRPRCFLIIVDCLSNVFIVFMTINSHHCCVHLFVDLCLTTSCSSSHLVFHAVLHLACCWPSQRAHWRWPKLKETRSFD